MDMTAFADIVAQAIETATAPLLARIAVLEKRQITHGRDGRDGKDAQVDLEALAMKAAALVPRPRDGVDGAQGPQGEPGVTSVGPQGIQGPAGSDGKDAPPVDLDAIAAKAAALVPRARDGQNGKDADPLIVAELKAEIAMLRGELNTKALAMKDGRDGADGRSVTIDDVAPLIASEVTKAVAALPKAVDGVGLSDALIDRDGALVFTFSNGQTKSVGRVVGANADPHETAVIIEQAIAALPRPKDGKDGADGLGFDDFEAYMDDSKGFVIRFEQGERFKEFPFPMLWDAGVYKPGSTYRKGAGVTAQGSFWIAQADTSERPGDGSTSWRLAVKRGRDGKDGKDGKNGDES